MAATIAGALDVVLLVKNGTQVNTLCTDQQQTALSMSQRYGHTDIEDFLKANL